jgi:transcriptional regulator with XRE-family HTH domain
MTRTKRPSRLSRTLARARRDRELTYKQLAAKVSVSPAHLCHIESGFVHEPAFRVVVRLARVLGLSLDELAGVA